MFIRYREVNVPFHPAELTLVNNLSLYENSESISQGDGMHARDNVPNLYFFIRRNGF